MSSSDGLIITYAIDSTSGFDTAKNLLSELHATRSKILRSTALVATKEDVLSRNVCTQIGLFLSKQLIIAKSYKKQL